MRQLCRRNVLVRLKMIKGDVYAEIDDYMRECIMQAYIEEGGIETACKLWNIPSRVIRNVLRGQRYVGLTWLDKFCCTANTTMTVDDFEWITVQEFIIRTRPVRGC